MDFAENLKKYANVKTISIAFPSSILDNCPTPLLEAYLVGQIARAAVVFKACEIVIFDEDDDKSVAKSGRTERLVKLFEYAECPQYLRKRIFSLEPDLKFAGTINPLEAQHHLRTSQIECPYREGVTIGYVTKEKRGTPTEFTEINIGLSKSFYVPERLELHSRVTLKVDPHDLKKVQSMLGISSVNLPEAMVVAPVEPVEKLNLYWGYYVRRANSLSKVMSDNTFVPDRKKFYDLIIGTSERGINVDEVEFKKTSKKAADSDTPVSKKQKSGFNHILIVFGGIKGLEHSAACDKDLKSVSDVANLFDYYINTCPGQGSTTIRTEEAILITLSSLRPKLNL